MAEIETFPLTPEAIAEFIATAAANKALNYAGSEALKKLIGGYDMGDVQQDMQTIIENQNLILQKLDAIMREVKWQSLVLEAAPAMHRITYCVQRTLDIAQMDPEERVGAAKELRDVILLDTDDGLRPALNTLHETLMGHSRLRPSDDGLLVSFIQRLDAKLRDWHHGITARTYFDSYETYFAGVLYLQLVGLTMLYSAYGARETGGANESDAIIQIERLDRNIADQAKLLKGAKSDLWAPFMADQHPAFLFNSPEGNFIYATEKSTLSAGCRIIYHRHTQHPGQLSIIQMKPLKSGNYAAYAQGMFFATDDLRGDPRIFGAPESFRKHVIELEIRPVLYRYPDNRYNAMGLLTQFGYLRPSHTAHYVRFMLLEFSDTLYAWRANHRAHG